ncbi:hypothetical protein [Marilutibacter chinensis]|uniref:Uncharacterized protein n=1 Tax=Marilutibacter chinensis TaxID=2912247 RepID=A0ABS9HXI8_9GAMM|nr:hypothetical protein [Lysobacter chinensis]MCF7223591.1 hypothetical protein [Lysobacter chinensis]
MKPSALRLATAGLALILAGAGPAGAGEVLRIKAIVEGQEGVGFAGSPRPIPVTLHLKPGMSRVDFNQRGAEGIYMLIDEQARQGWLIDAGQSAARPLQARGFAELRVDPRQPCENFGVRCRPIPSKVIAGVRAKGWRYLDAGQRGPGGTARGEFWVDEARGLILGYQGYRSGRSRACRMQVMSVAAVEDAASLFELPDAAEGSDARH